MNNSNQNVTTLQNSAQNARKIAWVELRSSALFSTKDNKIGFCKVLN
jgi:hypothetical protein